MTRDEAAELARQTTMQTSTPASATDDRVQFPPGHHTTNQWLLRHGRTVKKNARPKLVVPYKSGEARLFIEAQTEPASPYELAKAEYLRLFWLPFRSGDYLYGDDAGQSWTGHHGLPFDLVTKALQGKGHVGIWGVRNGWSRLVASISTATWTKGRIQPSSSVQCRPQRTLGEEKQPACDRPQGRPRHPLGFLRSRACPAGDDHQRIRERLQGIHEQHPEIAAAVEQHNAQEPTKNRHVKHINELEIFPSTSSGFRIFGHRGKAVVADKIISYVPHGTYRLGHAEGKINIALTS